MLSCENESDDDFELKDWNLSEVFTATTQVRDEMIHVAGIQAKHPQWGEAFGSAAGLHDYPLKSARFELLERITILEAMGRNQFDIKNVEGKFLRKAELTAVFPQNDDPIYQFARSNGVSLHDTWAEACKRACFELVERHVILSSWLGRRSPQLLAQSQVKTVLKNLSVDYRIVPVSFGNQAVDCFKNLIEVSGIFLFPRNQQNPMVMGFGAGFTAEESLLKAEQEALQRLGFLWGEDIPAVEPEHAASPLYHQEYYLFPAHHTKLEQWLAGEFLQNDEKRPADFPAMAMEFADLSHPLRPQLFVSKALSSTAIPLVFGTWLQGELSGLSLDRLIHPIA